MRNTAWVSLTPAFLLLLLLFFSLSLFFKSAFGAWGFLVVGGLRSVISCILNCDFPEFNAQRGNADFALLSIARTLALHLTAHCAASARRRDPHRLPNEQPHFDYFHSPPPPPTYLAGALPHFSSRCAGRGDYCAIGDSEVRSPFSVIFIRVNQLCWRPEAASAHPPDAPSAKRKTNTGLVWLLSAEKGGLGNVCIRQCIVSGWVGGGLCESNRSETNKRQQHAKRNGGEK